MKPFLFSDEDYNLWVTLSLTRRVMGKARSKETRQYDLSSRQAAVLIFAQAIGERATPAELARWLMIEPHTMSNVLSTMERRGLIQKVKDLGKKNLIRVALTEKGQEAYKKSIRMESVHSIMGALSAEERKRLRAYLAKLWDRALEELRTEVIASPAIDKDRRQTKRRGAV